MVLTGLKEAWNTSQQADKKRKITGIVTGKGLLLMKLELLTNATVVDEAIKFVSANLPKEREIVKDDAGDNKQ